MIKVGHPVHYIHNKKVEYKDESFTVNNGGVVETRTRRVRQDNGLVDHEYPFIPVVIHKLSDGTPVYDGWLFTEGDSEYLTDVLEGNPSTPGTLHEVD